MAREYSVEAAYAILAGSDTDSLPDSLHTNETVTASDLEPLSATESSPSCPGTSETVTASDLEPLSATESSPSSPGGSSEMPGESWVHPRMMAPDIPPFTGNPGIKVALQNRDPINYFGLFMSDDIFALIVTQSNLFASQYISAHPEQNINWKPTDVAEMKQFLALTLTMGIIKKPSIKSYWSKKLSFATPLFPTVMKRDRYLQIMRFLHFSDNALCPHRDDPAYDRLYKIRPLIKLLSYNFSANYNPEQNIAVDESLMKFKGRLLFKQYIPSKRSRYGIKLYKVCESCTGYTWAFRIYEGKDSHLDPPGCPDSVGTSGKIVWDLILPLLNKGYKLWVDNYYTSIELFQCLYNFETVACGTVRKNRRGFPQDLTRGRSIRGSTSALRQNELLALRYKDKKDVYMLSTMHDESTVPVSVRGRAEPLQKPQCIVDYSKYKGGVDLADQCIQPYLVSRKSRTWYKKVAIYLCQIATFNAYVLYKKEAIGKPYTFLCFMDKLLSPMLFAQPPMPRAIRENVHRLSGRHFPSQIPPTACKRAPQRRCQVCSKRGVRKESSYFCNTCPTKPALCIANCFRVYHTELEF